MSEAGKDANARPDLAGDSLPVRTIARVAPQSVQLAKDNALLGRSVWCGMVCAVAAVVTVVNLLPPAGVAYRVTNQIVVSPKRYDLLKAELKKSKPSSTDATLIGVRLLDESSNRRLADPNGSQLLLEVSSLWPHRTSMQLVQKWLSSISTLDEHAVSHIEAARIQRFARWEVETREQYLRQHREALLAKRNAEIDKPASGLADAGASKYSSNIKLASTPTKPRLKFATLGQGSESTADPSSEASPSTDLSSTDSSLAGSTNSATSSNSDGSLELSGPENHEAASPSDEFEKQLQSELEVARQVEQNVTSEVANQARQASGKLTIAGSARVHAVPERMPRNQVLSIIVLALAVGALGGWVNHRAQSGGTFRAVDVSRSLQLLGLPVLGNVHLPTSELAGIEGEVTRRFTDVRRWLMQQCLALAELAVLFWCLAILIRMVLDPLWRGLVWENPLSGLARLFVGLP